MSDHNELHVEEQAVESAPGDERAAALRALRSLEATQERVVKNAKRETEEAKGKLVMELLPVLDNLDRTIAASKQHGGDPALLEGVRMVRTQLESVLQRYGVEKVDAAGQKFDPAIHEAIGVHPVADPRANGFVVQQYEPGFAFNGKLLRPAKVLVGKFQGQRVPGPYWH
jgi:molecular chaperone GrpE